MILYMYIIETEPQMSAEYVHLRIFNTLYFQIHVYVHTVMHIIKLNSFPVPVRLHSGSGKLNFVLISHCIAIFKNVVHSLEPCETPSYSASHQAPNYVQRY